MSLFSWFNSADQVDAALVIVAVVGAVIEVGVALAAVINVHKELEESRKVKLEKYIEVFACVAAFFFLAEAILGCRSSMLLAKEIEKFKGDNLVLQTNVASLNGVVIQLAHQYDLSTNALAEAEERLKFVRPIKERLIDFLNSIDAGIIPAFRSGQTNFQYGIPEYQYNKLLDFANEPDGATYLEINSSNNGSVFWEGGVQVEYGTLKLKPPLLR